MIAVKLAARVLGALVALAGPVLLAVAVVHY